MAIQDVFTSNLSSLGSQVTFTTQGKDAGTLKAMQASDLVQTNLAAAQFGSTVKLNALQQAAAVSDGSSGPRYISNQILAEPVKAISPDSLISSAIAVNSTMAQAIVGKAPEKLDKLADLSQTPDKINSQPIKDCLKAAGKKCATLAEQEANQAELAHGNTLEVSAASKTIAGNAIRLHSDTTIATRAPHYGLNTQDYHVQANNSAILVADIQMNQVNQSLHLVENSHITQAKTGLVIATEAHDTISQSLRNVGVQEYTSMGKTHTAVADETMVNLSGGDISSAAYGAIAHRAGGDIQIISSPNGKTSETTHATGESSGTTPAQEKVGQITIMGTDGLGLTNVMALTPQGNVSSSTSHVMTVAGKSAVMSGQQGAISISPKMTFMGSPSGGIMVRGRRVYVNTMPSIVSNMNPLRIQELPSLPALPQIPTDKLENCIPADAKKGGTSPTQPGTDTGTDTGTSNPTASGDNVQLKPGGRSAINPKQMARPLEQGSATQATPGMKPSKLPGVSTTDAADKTQSAGIGSVPGIAAIDGGGLTGAGMNIYIDRYDDSPAISLTESLVSGNTTKSLAEALDDIDLLYNASTQALRAASITPELITSHLAGVLPANALSAFNDPELFKALGQTDLTKVLAGTITGQDFPAGIDSSTVTKALKLIQAYPDARAAIVDIISVVTALPAIGFLEALGSLVGNLKIPGLSNISQLTQLPNMISSGNLGGLFQLASPYLSSLLKGSPLEKLLGNGSLLNIGQSLLSGNMAAIQGSVQGAIMDQVGNLLGSQFSSVVPMIGNLLMGLKAGQPLDASSLIGQLGPMFGGDVAKATQIFGTLQPIISDISSGNLLNLVTGGGIQSLLSQVLGGKNAGEIGKIFGMLQQAMGTVQSLAALPQLLQLMNQYKIPAIDQIGMALSCLDLFNKIKGLLDQAKGMGSNDALPTSSKEAAQFVDSAGRLVQTLNSIQELTPEQQEALNIDPIIINLTVLVDLDPCFKLPRLTLAESQITVTEVKPAKIMFSVDNLQLLQTVLSKLPKIGDQIQLRISHFIDNKTGAVLIPYQTDFQYTPFNYNYIITDFSLDQNTGIAVFANNVTSMILEDNQGILYEYDPQGIGSQLTPIIKDSYLFV